jgi:putative ATP-binding cassette transporter
LLLVGSVVLQLVLQYRLNYWSRDFFDAFGRRDGPALREEAVSFLVLAGLSIGMAVSTVWARMATQRKWRAWLTRLLMDRWLANRNFRQLTFAEGEDRNPEFRIAEDVRVATDVPVALAAGLLTAFLSAVLFIGILWNVGGDLDVDILGVVMTVPKYLVITVSIYSAILTLAITVIGRRMTRVIAGKNAAEAQFRSVASHLRELGRTDDRTKQQDKVDLAFTEVVLRWRRLCSQIMRTTAISHGNILAAPIIGWVLCAPKYLGGTMSLGEVAQAVAAFVVVQGALNWLVDNYPGLAECLSSVNRVSSLLTALDEIEQDEPVQASAAPGTVQPETVQPDTGTQKAA